MKQQPTLSIVMPVLNRADTVEKALQSVIEQQYPHVELIVIDGGSTDGTVDIIKRYLPHISYWQSQRDGNPTNAMNMGIEKCTGDFIAILMADDWYEKDLFHAISQAYEANPAAEIITCGGRIVSFDKQTQTYRTQLEYLGEEKLTLSVDNICFKDISAICCRFISRSLYQRLGVYSPHDKYGDYVFSNDKEFLLRVALQNVVNAHVNIVGHTYLAHAGSSTFGKNHANILRMCREHMMMAEKFLQYPTLTRKQRWQFRYWFNDQASRLMAYHTLDGDFKKTLGVMKESLKKYPFLLPVSFLATTLRLARKKL